MNMDAYHKAIEALLAKVAEAEDAAEASRLAEVAINLTHAAERLVVAMEKAVGGPANK